MENKKPRTIYGLVDPRDGRVRYVGATNNPAARLRSHLLAIERGTASIKRGEWLRDLVAVGLEPMLVILEENVPAGAWRTREREWIEHFAPDQLVNGKAGPPKGHRLKMPRPASPEDMDPSELRAFRLARGWSQGELGRRLGVDYSTVSRWEASARHIPRNIRLALERLAGGP